MKPVKAVMALMTFITIQTFLLYYFMKTQETVELQCSSTFTRNAYEDYGFFFKGKFIVDLRKNGEGELTIKAYTDDPKPLQVVRVYNFKYILDRDGQFHNEFLKETRGASDNVNNDFYKKYFFDLNFDSRGQIRLRRFNNIILFMTPDLLISACSPLK